MRFLVCFVLCLTGLALLPESSDAACGRGGGRLIGRALGGCGLARARGYGYAGGNYSRTRVFERRTTVIVAPALPPAKDSAKKPMPKGK